MNASAIPVTEPAAQTEPASEAPAVERRPLSELLPTGTLRLFVALGASAAIVASFADFGFHGRALLGAVFCPVLVLLAAIDLKHRVLPNAIVLPATLVVGVIVAASTPHHFVAHLLAALALGGFFFAFAAFFPGSIGMGDAKLGLMLGLALGAKTLGGVLIAFVGLLVAALYVLASRGMSARKDALPFGPFLAVGGIVAFFLGGGI
jgi:leader peptidase (prepilin peptidase)/N-methyltransferase